MKKALFLALALAVGLGLCANGAWAYTINDPSNDAIGVGFESYGINILNYTPPNYTAPGISFQVFTDYPKAGVSVAGWDTKPADLFIQETYYGNSYLWAIPLATHGSFIEGTMYAVGTYKISDDFQPANGVSYLYNHNIPVQIATLGDNYGCQSFGGGITWNSAGGNPNLQVDVVLNCLYQDDPNGKWNVFWGTATCANDVVGNVPLPPSVLLMGTGLLGLGLLRFRRKDAA